MASISFHFEDTKRIRIPLRSLRSYIQLVVESENAGVGEISVVFCSDAFLMDMNVKYLNHDYYTDILTFEYKETEDISGDLVISMDRVRENAVIFGKKFENELVRVVVHGILHLLGYTDDDDENQGIMRDKEDYYLGKFGI